MLRSMGCESPSLAVSGSDSNDLQAEAKDGVILKQAPVFLYTAEGASTANSSVDTVGSCGRR